MTKNRIDTKLAQCKAEGKKALITFITAGDGGYDCTEKAVLEMVENGADLIELGVPSAEADRCAAAADDVPEHHFLLRHRPFLCGVPGKRH